MEITQCIFHSLYTHVRFVLSRLTEALQKSNTPVFLFLLDRGTFKSSFYHPLSLGGKGALGV
jgi:hypothetical protein